MEDTALFQMSNDQNISADDKVAYFPTSVTWRSEADYNRWLFWSSSDHVARWRLHTYKTHLLSCHAGMHAVTTVEFTAEGMIGVLIHRFTPLVRLTFPRMVWNSIWSSKVIYRLLRVIEITINVNHSNKNGGVKHINHTVAQMLPMVTNERQNSTHLFHWWRLTITTPWARPWV